TGTLRATAHKMQSQRATRVISLLVVKKLLTTTEAEHQVEGGLLLDVVVSKSAAILQLLAGKDETLLVRRNALLVLDLGLHVVNGVGGFHFKCDGLAGEGLDEDLHASPKAEDKVKGGLLLDVVVSKGPAILELLASEDEALLGVGGFHLKCDGLAGEGLDEDLHASPKAEDKVKSGLLLDVVVSKGPAILELLASEDEALLVRRDALLVLNLGLHVVDGVRRLHLKGDGLASQRLDEDLH
uniref:Uncharacterized protein n=1 Tax=Aegilops tauschii subsp. strangulata TaxID=200361 RepID=A0A453NC63_AEGTS